MKSFAVLATVLAVAAPAVAQLTALPPCALQPAIAAVGSTGCAVTNVTCACSDSAFVQALAPAIQAACNATELQQAIVAAENLCSSAGVTLSIPAPTASGSATASGSISMSSMSSAASMASATASPSMYPTSMPTTSATVSNSLFVSSSTSMSAASASSASGSAASASSASATVAVQTGAAAVHKAWEAAVGAVAAGAAFAML